MKNNARDDTQQVGDAVRIVLSIRVHQDEGGMRLVADLGESSAQRCALPAIVGELHHIAQVAPGHSDGVVGRSIAHHEGADRVTGDGIGDPREDVVEALSLVVRRYQHPDHGPTLSESNRDCRDR